MATRTGKAERGKTPPDERDALLRLGRALRDERKSRGLKQAEVARLTGVGLATLSHLEQGNADPRASTILRVAEALRLDLRFERRDEVAERPAGSGGYDLDELG